MTSTTEFRSTITSLLPAAELATLHAARAQIAKAKASLASLTQAKASADSQLAALGSAGVIAGRAKAAAAAFMGNTAIAVEPDTEAEAKTLRLVVTGLADEIVAATSALQEWTSRAALAEVALLKAFQRTASKFYAECADQMIVAFSVIEAGHRLLDDRKSGGLRTPAWTRLGIPLPDAAPRLAADDNGLGWSTALARESGECARATEALTALVAE